MPASELRILVVEDDSRVRRELLDALRAVGYEAVSYTHLTLPTIYSV